MGKWLYVYFFIFTSIVFSIHINKLYFNDLAQTIFQEEIQITRNIRSYKNQNNYIQYDSNLI